MEIRQRTPRATRSTFRWFMATAMLLALASGCAAPPAKPATSDDSRDCLLLTQLHSTRAISDSEILFRLYGGDQWVNRVEPGCTGLRFDRGFTYDTRLHKLCRGQIIHGRNPARTPCTLGVFRPWHGEEQAPQ